MKSKTICVSKKSFILGSLILFLLLIFVYVQMLGSHRFSSNTKASTIQPTPTPRAKNSTFPTPPPWGPLPCLSSYGDKNYIIPYGTCITDNLSLTSQPKSYQCVSCASVLKNPQAKYNCLKTMTINTSTCYGENDYSCINKEGDNNFECKPLFAGLPTSTPTPKTTSITPRQKQFSSSSFPSSSSTHSPTPALSPQPFLYNTLANTAVNYSTHINIYIYPTMFQTGTNNRVIQFINAGLNELRAKKYEALIQQLDIKIIITCDWPRLFSVSDGRVNIHYASIYDGCAYPEATPAITPYLIPTP